MRPLLHFAPSHGWLNDPNGLIQWKGLHHLFFQYNPAGTEFTNQHWGHATSTNLVAWTEHEVALSPGDPVREPYDSTACFSGCAVVVGDRVAIVYSGVEGDVQLPCLAYATDDSLRSFVKDPDNPVIAAPPSADVAVFRDHAVWRDGDVWRQVVGGQSTEVGGAVFGYTSNDLRHWTYDQVLADAVEAGIPDGVWECPDLFRVDGTDVLVVSLIRPPHDPGHEVWWMTGRLEGGRFAVERTGPADFGPRLYAPQSYTAEDGRRLMLGWIRTHEDPASAGAVSLGAMSLPRQLRVVDGRLLVEPADELLGLRRSCRELALTESDHTVVALDPATEVAGELVLDGPAADRLKSFTLLDDAGHQLTVDPRAIGGSGGPVTVYWDAGIVELFRDGRAGVWTNLSLRSLREVSLRHARGEGGVVSVWKVTGTHEHE
ncbi:hypothetical protein acdb102_30650 [Acidothermaceae bacterium B102]|nr:hypothetical protein acdb102_30650 [Acidothermaceae bacterium B102]